MKDEGPIIRAAKKKARDAAYRKAHHESIKAFQRAYYRKNSERIRANQNRKTKGCAECGKPICTESSYCTKCVRLKERNYRWAGGKRIDRWGYVLMRVVSQGGKMTEVREHRLIMKHYLGRKLSSAEIVHHIDGDTKNNRLDNLMLFPNHRAHRNYHVQAKA